jgi:aryl-alcohol dehydrogenase-like predicted oxidoreductase
MSREYDLGILAWGPLAHGVLAGRYTDAAKLPEGSRGTLKTIYRDRITREGIEVGMKPAAGG